MSLRRDVGTGQAALAPSTIECVGQIGRLSSSNLIMTAAMPTSNRSVKPAIGQSNLGID